MRRNKRQQTESSSEKEEEYEVQNIVGHKIVYAGKKKTPSLKYHIKWKGYSDSDNTWESEASTDHCKDLVDEYWNNLNKGKAERAKVERILKGEASESEEDDDDFVDAKSTPPAKKKPTTVSGANKKRRVAPPVETRNKSSAAAASSSGKRRKTTRSTRAGDDSEESEVEPHAVNQEEEEEDEKEQEDDDDDEEDFSESEIEHDDFRARSNNWAKDVDKIVKVRNGTDKDNQQNLYGIVRWRDGKLGIYKTSFLTKKIPQLLIQYYEKRLTFESKE